MKFQLAPDVPIVQRDAETLQVGAGADALILTGVTAPLEAMLARLRRGGVTRDWCLTHAARNGLDADLVGLLIDRLTPHLHAASSSSGSVAIRGPGAQTLAERLAGTGIRAITVADGLEALANREPIRLLVELGGPAFHASRAVDAMSLDLPHLAARAVDGGVSVGPLVMPGVTPCLSCDDLNRRALDPDFTRMRETLATIPTRGPMADPLGAEIVTRQVIAIARDRRDFLRGTVVHISREGTPTVREVAFNDRCACRALPGSDSASAQGRRASRNAPTRAEGAFSPA